MLRLRTSWSACDMVVLPYVVNADVESRVVGYSFVTTANVWRLSYGRFG